MPRRPGTIAHHPNLLNSIRSNLWLLPLLSALLFISGVLVWAYRADRDETDERRKIMIIDALSSEAQLRSRLDSEMSHLEELGRQIPNIARNAVALAENAEVASGLRRLWLSVTWLDSNNRIVAEVPGRAPLATSTAGDITDGPSTTSHLSLAVGKESLVVRYSPALLLRRGIPWWLTRKYDVQFADSSEEVIASFDQVPLALASPERESYTVLVGRNLPGAYLQLTLREHPLPFWRGLPLVLVAGFLILMVIATLLLRRQVLRITLAEASWRTEAAWRKAMEDSALVGLRARDFEGKILYVNRTFCEMVGLAAENLLGLLPPMPYWPSGAIEEVMARNQRNLAGNAPREGYEALWSHHDGRLLNVMVFESPFIDAHGTQIGWMGSIIDISARKKLEERERQQAETMANQSRLTTLGEIASALAHQLNQPLTAIIGYNAGLQRMLSDANYGNQAVMGALIQQGEQAKEAGRIVHRIREFLTRRAPQWGACDLASVGQRALSLLKQDLRASNIHVEWISIEDLPLVRADPILMEQVLINLIRNASDAMEGFAKGGKLRLSLYVADLHFVSMDIEDDGPGLGGLMIEQLCTPFYSTKSDGMGMGLAICRSVIEVHHGSMDATGSSLGGARFSFTLPIYDTRSSSQ
ncbi:nitrogen regulation protein NR(II) [Rhodoferax sp. PAMC 29310]|uniref:two-component system sensor histidine kinase NtrB n=1 Tax=Rhodoferax sp. PAMC 29310 TaxID=2822760 RepID=UPI001B344629|nr:PAS domain S-box protein [Rhodoferax sp. PAMC 29310]